MSSENTSPAEEASEAQDATDRDVWVELKRGSEGVSLSVYESVGGETEVLDEAWWTWSEFAGIDSEDLPNEISETTKLDANSNQCSRAEPAE